MDCVFIAEYFAKGKTLLRGASKRDFHGSTSKIDPIKTRYHGTCREVGDGNSQVQLDDST